MRRKPARFESHLRPPGRLLPRSLARAGFAGPRGSLENARRQWHVGGPPHVPLLERPRVDRIAVANQLEQTLLAKLLRGPLVHALQPREDHGVVEQPTEAPLVGDVGLDIASERIAVGEHAAEREEGPGHPEPWIAEHAAQ